MNNIYYDSLLDKFGTALEEQQLPRTMDSIEEVL